MPRLHMFFQQQKIYPAIKAYSTFIVTIFLKYKYCIPDYLQMWIATRRRNSIT